MILIIIIVIMIMKNVIYSVVYSIFLPLYLQICRQEDEVGELLVPLEFSAVQRTAFYTGVPETTVYRITRSETSSTTKKKPGPKKLTMDDSDKEVLRRTVREIMSIDKVLPTTAIILKDMQEKIGGETNLRSILKEVGFRCECLHCS